MTATIGSGPAARDIARRSHPEKFPHPRPTTVIWYLDETGAPSESNQRRFSTQEDLLAKLKAELGERMKRAEIVGTGRFLANASLPAVLLLLSKPLEILAGAKARELIIEVTRSAKSTGIYIGFAFTRTDCTDLRAHTKWGTALLDQLYRDQAGDPVYGNWC